MKLYYWMNTVGKKQVLFNTFDAKEEPPKAFVMMYGMKRCNRLVYNLYKYLNINWLAKDKFAWLKH